MFAHLRQSERLECIQDEHSSLREQGEVYALRDISALRRSIVVVDTPYPTDIVDTTLSDEPAA